MSTNKGLSDRGECSRSIHGIKRDWPPNDVTAGGDGLTLLPWPLPPILPEFEGNNNGHYHSDNHLCLPPLPPHPYKTLFNSRLAPMSQFDYLNDDGQQADHQFRIISDEFGMPELGNMTAHEIMDAKALAASKSHSAAERRRRERINYHLDKLRSLLPSTTKTDKATLLAEVIQHLKELKLQTSLIAETIPIPTENDELRVEPAEDNRGHMVRASLCCEDRSDLLPDLIKALKALHLRTRKAEITTLGGRIRNTLVVTGEEAPNQGNNYTGDQQQWQWYSVSLIQEGLKAVIEKSGEGTQDESYTGNVKRQRTNTGSILERRSL